MPEFDSLTDTELIAAFQAGDEAAFTGIYDRYGHRVYSYALNVTDSREVAAQVTLEVFARTVESLTGLQEPEPFRGWLFSVARREIRSTGRDVAVSGDPDPGDGLRREVLDATEDLGARDRHLMNLHLVEGLEGQDLAQAMGVDESNLEVLVARMRRRVEGALGALLLARLGNPDCDDVEEELGGRGDVYDTRVRALLNKHIGGCERCQERRAILLSPRAALPGIMVVAAPPELRARVRVGVAAARRDDSATPGGEAGPVSPDPQPDAEPDAEPVPVPAMPPPVETPATVVATADIVTEDDGSHDLAKLAIFMVVTIALGLIGLSVAGRFDPLELPEGEAGPPIDSSTTSTSSPEGPTTTGTEDVVTTTTAVPASPPSIEVGTEVVDFGDGGTSAEFEVTNSGGSAGEIGISSSSEAIALSTGEATLAAGETGTFQVSLDRDQIEEGDIAETIRVVWPGGEAEIAVVGAHEDNPIIHDPQANPPSVEADGGAACTTQTTVSARVRDTSPLESVVARWNDGSRARETAMEDAGGDIFQGVIGPFAAPQTAEVRIVAFDERGNAGGAVISVNVLPCS